MLGYPRADIFLATASQLKSDVLYLTYVAPGVCADIRPMLSEKELALRRLPMLEMMREFHQCSSKTNVPGEDVSTIK